MSSFQIISHLVLELVVFAAIPHEFECWKVFRSCESIDHRRGT